MTKLGLEIQLDGGDGPYKPGDWVRGRVAVLAGGKSRALNAELHFRERTSDYSEVGATFAIPPLHRGDLPSGTSYPFAIQLPADALPSLDWAHGSLSWEVVAKSDERGFDTVETRRIQVVAAD